MKTKVIVRDDYLFVACIARDEEAEKALFIVDPIDLNSHGVILYSGPNAPSELSPGTKVIFSSQHFPVTVEGVTSKVMRSNNVVAILSA